jgi:hypothetical protein
MEVDRGRSMNLVIRDFESPYEHPSSPAAVTTATNPAATNDESNGRISSVRARNSLCGSTRPTSLESRTPAWAGFAAVQVIIIMFFFIFDMLALGCYLLEGVHKKTQAVFVPLDFRWHL